MANVKSTNTKCEQCKGECWDNDPAKRQENAFAKFGIIPNNCVDSEIDGPKCPYYKP